jgi:hypothetical protein
MTCPVILQVFFDKTAPRDGPYGEGKTFLDMSLWFPLTPWPDYWKHKPEDSRPSKEPVYRWSCDMAVCADERWTVFGPFKGAKEAKDAFYGMNETHRKWTRGYRIINEHCAGYFLCKGFKEGSEPKWPRDLWTDG